METQYTIEMLNITKRFPGIIANDNITLQLKKGEIHALLGENGAGKSTLMSVLFGLYQPEEGIIKKDGKEVKINQPIDAMNLGMGMLPDDRKAEGIIGDLSVRENIILAMQAKRGIVDLIPMKEQEEIADKFIELLQIKCASRETPVKQLSGGNQQKVIFGRWMLTEPEIFLLDEPTRGIDVGAKALVLEALKKFNRESGVTVVMISSELEELRQICDRIAIVSGGRVAGILPADHSSEEFGMLMVSQVK